MALRGARYRRRRIAMLLEFIIFPGSHANLFDQRANAYIFTPLPPTYAQAFIGIAAALKPIEGGGGSIPAGPRYHDISFT